MTIKTRIFKPHSKLNELENRYKIVIFRDGSQVSLRFTKTKAQALEIERRFKNRFK